MTGFEALTAIQFHYSLLSPRYETHLKRNVKYVSLDPQYDAMIFISYLKCHRLIIYLFT